MNINDIASAMVEADFIKRQQEYAYICEVVHVSRTFRNLGKTAHYLMLNERVE